MGRLIDASELHNTVMLNKSEWGIFATPIDQLVEGLVSQVSTAEAIPKADYENRLKADMVAMLEDLRLDFQEAELVGVFDNKELIFADEVDDLVQQKINSLKEASDGDK